MNIGTLFESDEKIKVYKDNTDEIIYEWLSDDILNVLKEENFKEVTGFGFKVHFIKCNEYNNSKLWKLTYSVFRSNFMGGGTHYIDDMNIKIRDIKLRNIIN